MKLSLAEILRYSPYDHNYNLESSNFDENIFKEHFLYVTNIIQSEKIEFENALSIGKSERKPYILLSGYSGCGKTTLLYYLKDELNKEHGHKVHILNPTFEVKIGDTGIDRLRTTIEKEVTIGAFSSFDILSMVLENITIVRKIRKVEGLDTENLSSTLEGILSKFVLLSNDHDKRELISLIQEFVEEASLTELIFYFLLEKIFNFKQYLFEKYPNQIIETVSTENLVVCFDNMDELSLSSFTVDFWTSYRRAEAAIQTILHETNFLFKGDTHKFMTIVMTLRESNVALYSSQWDDRWDPKFLKRRLILDGDVTEIMSLRSEFISKNEKLFENDATSKLKALIDIFNTDKEWIRSQVLPLFNFDYRKYFEFLPSLLKRDSSALGRIQYNFKYSEYLSLDKTNRTIARGVMYSYLIQFAFITYFNKFISKPEDSCNKFRMLLTIMFNLAYPDGVPDDIKERNRKRPKHFTIQEILENAKIFTEQEVLDMTVEFFPHEESSYAHWIMIYESNLYLLNSRLYNYDDLKLKKVTDLSKDEISFIDMVENSLIHFNASAFAYLRYIITHYEYYLYLVRWENKDLYMQSAPLALLTGVNYKIPCFEFENQISLVLQFVIRKKNKIEEYYKSKFISDFPTESSYSKSKYAFGETASKKSFYITKLITTHINYLDNFRYLAWYNYDFNAALNIHRKSDIEVDRFTSLPLKSNSQIQDFIISVIEKYINLYLEVNYRDFRNDKTLLQMKEKIIEIRNLKNSKNGDYNYPVDSGTNVNNNWIWIRSDKLHHD